MGKTKIVLDIIYHIQEEKRQTGVHPCFALYAELSSATGGFAPAELKQALNTLCKTKQIKHGRTLNDLYFAVTRD